MTMKNESGRSMVEMLGVLAIIGVLSIGGIAGYTMAMNRYRANEIIDTASKTAIIAMTANAGVGAEYTWSNVKVPCADTITSDRYGNVSVKLSTGCDAVKDVIQSLAEQRTENCTAATGADLCIDFGDISAS